MSETMNKGCELCRNPARMWCESDQATLCWDCDEKVHATNFLVAKHSRTLLCRVCQSPTAWKAAGPKLGPTVSVCHACSAHAHPLAPPPSTSRRLANDDEDASLSDRESEADDGEYYSETDEDFSDEEEEEEGGENQVVPWSTSASVSPLRAAAAANSSSSEEDVYFCSTKRAHDNTFDSEDEDGCCSSSRLGASNSDEKYSYSMSLLRPQKIRRRSHDIAVIQSEQAAEKQAPRFNTSSSGTAAIVEKLQRFDEQEGDASAMIRGFCKLTGD